MIRFRPHKGDLIASLHEMKRYTTLHECIAEQLKKYEEVFKARENEIYLIPYVPDMRIGWEDQFLLCIAPYSQVQDQEGYVKYFGGKFETPQQFLGYVDIGIKHSEERIEDFKKDMEKHFRDELDTMLLGLNYGELIW